METFGALFKENLIGLFRKYHEKDTTITSSYFTKDYISFGDELIYQYSIRDQLANSYKMKDSLFKDVARFIKSKKQLPFVIYGESGSGKSSLMAFLAKNVTFK